MDIPNLLVFRMVVALPLRLEKTLGLLIIFFLDSLVFSFVNAFVTVKSIGTDVENIPDNKIITNTKLSTGLIFSASV